MGWIYPFRGKSAVDVAAATTKVLADIGDAVECFRTDNGAKFTNEMFATSCRDKTIRHELSGVNMARHNVVVERGLSMIQDSGMVSCIEALRPFPRQLPHLDRFWVEAAIYMNDCLNTTATTPNARYMLPYEDNFGRLPPSNTLTFMQLGFAAFNAPTSRIPRRRGASTSTGGRTTRGIPSWSSRHPA